MLKELRKISLRAKIAIIIAFFFSIYCCAVVIETKLSQSGCKSSMAFMDYFNAGGIGFVGMFLSFMFVGGLLFGILSIPKAIKNYVNKLKIPEERDWLCHNTKDTLMTILVSIGGVAAMVVVIGILGTLFGYVGWLLFC